MSKIRLKVLAGFITGHIATIAAVLAALLKLVPGDPKVYAFFGEALTWVHFAAGYATKEPERTVLQDLQALLASAASAQPPVAPTPVAAPPMATVTVEPPVAPAPSAPVVAQVPLAVVTQAPSVAPPVASAAPAAAVVTP